MSAFWHTMNMPKMSSKTFKFSKPEDSESVETHLQIEHILFLLTKYKQNEVLLIFRRHYILEI